MSKIRLEEVANQRIESFTKRFGKAHLYLAYHAAFPLALTPDLLYRLWVKFNDEVLNIPWVAVADLLVSSLCNEVGYELYEMDLAVRNLLLSRLQEDKKFGQQRINELSNFLLDYVRQKLQSDDPDIQDFAQTQQWTALAYTQPSKVAHELALEFENLNHKDIAGLVRMASLTEIFTEPLADFQPLLIYARAMGKFARGNLEAAKDELSKVPKEGDVIRVAGVSLPIPEEIKPNQKKQKLTRRLILKIPLARVASVGGMIFTTLLIGLGYSTYRLSSECPSGQQKEFGLLCIEDKAHISNGDRTLFPIIKNSYRDQGIQAFKQQKYQEAIQLFGEAVKADPSDPEVLIYQNNALAKQKGNPFTLAVAVPADNNPNIAQEILRGVSQAQNEFNQNNGLNSRLLEIKIDNDTGQPEQARQIAVELVKDSSVLGVIGHYNSSSTEAALEEYNKTDIPVISPTSTSRQLQGKKNFFITLPSNAAVGKKLADYTFKTLKLTKVVIFSNPNSSYSESIREEFTKIFENLGGQVVHKPQINLADTSLDMDAEVAKSFYRYKAEGSVLIPDRQYIGVALKIARANQDIVDRFKSLNSTKSGLKLLGADTLYSNDTLTQGGNAVEGLIVVVPWFREAPQAKIFNQKAIKQWGGAVSWRTATSYDATQAFIQALSPNSDRTTVIDKLRNPDFVVNNTSTSGDPLQFSPQGERQTEPILVQIQGGRWVMPPQ